jgi:hypothetical protein
MSPDWQERVDDHAYLVAEDGLRAACDRHGVGLIGYRELRELMRSE